MTIIQPSRYNSIIRFLIVFFAILLLGGGITIFQYKAVADFRHELRDLKNSLVVLGTMNAELKNQFYASIETGTLEALAFDLGLVLDKTPDYMSSNQWLSDSSY